MEIDTDTDQENIPPSKQNKTKKSEVSLLKDKTRQIIQKTIIKEKPSHGNLVYDILESSNMKSNIKIQNMKQESTINDFKDMIQESQQNIDNKNQFFFQSYGQDYQEIVVNNVPNNSNCLRNHSIRQILRSKMADWMIEVLMVFNNVGEETYFRAMSILDQYLKLEIKQLCDTDIHLLGIACIFLASKIEDIYHIDLNTMVQQVAHNKFSAEQIKKAEWNIYTTLNFDVMFPNHFQNLQWLYYQVIYSDCQIHQNIKETINYILKMCLIDYKVMRHHVNILSYSIVKYSIQLFFDSFIEQENEDLFSYKDLIFQRLDSIAYLYNQDQDQIYQCYNEIVALSSQFCYKYPDFNNLQKYSN